MAYTTTDQEARADLAIHRDLAAASYTVTIRPASVGDAWVCEIVDARLDRVAIALDLDRTEAMNKATTEAWTDLQGQA